MNKVLATALLTLVLVIATSGCRSIDSNNKTTWRVPRITAAETPDDESLAEPVRMAVIWKDGVYEPPGQPIIRGFGARIFFYDAGDKAVKADGELVVYGFDEEDKKNDSSANRTFVFRQSDFQTHYGKTDIGHSYSVWVPWEKMGGYRKSVALIPVFKTATGNLIRSEQSIAVLPGKSPGTSIASSRSSTDSSRHGATAIRAVGFEEPGIEEQRDAGSSVQNADYVSTDADHSADDVTTDRFGNATTIKLPRNLADRMKQIPNNPDSETVNRVRVTTFNPAEIKRQNAADEAGQNNMLSAISAAAANAIEPIEPAATSNTSQPNRAAARPAYGQPGPFR